ncbi:MAG: hypothetical protein K8S98_13865 [Planctomycetes bacterium]|nr:hypothetical protein [Planctomycetota bacterium]
MSLLATWTVAVLAWWGPDFGAELRTLAGPDTAAASAAFASLVSAGDPAVAAAVAGFAELPAAERRARARFFAAAVGDATLGSIAPALDDPDPAVRRSILLAFAEPRLRASDGLALRVERVAARLEVETDAPLRALGLETLARLADPRALDALERSLGTLQGDDRRLAARALASRASGRARVIVRVERALSAAGGDADDVLAEWLRAGFGEAVAEQPESDGGEHALSVFVRATRHPSPEIRAAGAAAFDAYIERLRFLGEIDRAERAFALALRRGFADTQLCLAAARFALESGRSPEPALVPLERVFQAADEGDLAGRRVLANAYVLRGAAELCLRRLPDADASFARAIGVLESLIEDVAEQGGPALTNLSTEALELRGACEAWRVLVALASGAAPNDPAVLEHALVLHRCSLRAQAVEWRDKQRPVVASLDEVLKHRSGPLRLFLLNDRAGGVPRELRLKLVGELGDALATIAPEEVPGFRPAAVTNDVASFLADPKRLGVFEGVRQEWIARQKRELAALEAALQRRSADDRRIGDLGGAVRRLKDGLSSLESDKRWAEGVRSNRWPSDFALNLSATLRAEGRSADARELAERSIAAFESAGSRLDYSVDWLIARAEAAVGASYTDDNDGDAADRMLNRALTRYTGLERSFREQSDGAATADTLRGACADTLTSLAVNANVKRKRPDLALEYFERSIALEQNEFSLVLLACYRARAGRTAEARALLAEVPAAPGNNYNLACTWALLGDRDTALEYLRRELADPDASRGSRDRQKVWAKDDPDLASLRGDPRFEELLH